MYFPCFPFQSADLHEMLFLVRGDPDEWHGEEVQQQDGITNGNCQFYLEPFFCVYKTVTIINLLCYLCVCVINAMLQKIIVILEKKLLIESLSSTIGTGCT